VPWLALIASGLWLVSLRQVRTIQCHNTNWRQATELAAARIALLRAKHEVDNVDCHFPARCHVNDAVCLGKNASKLRLVEKIQAKPPIEASVPSVSDRTQEAARGRVPDVPLASTIRQGRLP
jgi:hypothetical protein